MGELKVMPYRFTVHEGDMVELPDGNTGVIEKVDFFMGGNSKSVKVRPTGIPWYRRLGMKHWFYDEQIDALKFLAGKERR
ncbi:hypothetical protein A2926_03975 [Candidatus Giovannonibacteria bacterium RIFCSPLOWO2_01_FULL_44_40]|uniref:Uncharacterized protein n=1 Tax=Candidatus Giovannonibacteria bacterium RIFCSPHIGHO2_01_FULL_45_23 TaxID=1798325 RepID=A0A1F5VIT9_9BACT|nr:MAG: hypothetical protein A2834_04135 [Candidatus Giovannonibacteria bacterium RIFCSPHIGHO2_01_FULL_45_23]OGF75522.1 MAG: hypothetical protein A3C77_00650 [Candidatus Giovannonibacteria bacterium RIFCSPHIGHO2_02_FULL_45_13]OGF80149.1 MAG: hypothetical protein A2926_03975 [Candidatus Giovannonibacteria bacterium RIFCSPLOWO2_01_FULL_44_40]